MNIFNEFERRIKNTLKLVLPPGGGVGELDLSSVVVEPPRDAAHGDLATNAAMVLAKPLGTKPRELAMRIAAALARDEDIDAAEVAGKGRFCLSHPAGPDAYGPLPRRCRRRLPGQPPRYRRLPRHTRILH